MGYPAVPVSVRDPVAHRNLLDGARSCSAIPYSSGSVVGEL